MKIKAKLILGEAKSNVVKSCGTLRFFFKFNLGLEPFNQTYTLHSKRIYLVYVFLEKRTGDTYTAVLKARNHKASKSNNMDQNLRTLILA